MLHCFVGISLVQTRCENLKFHKFRIYIPRLIDLSQRFSTWHVLIQLHLQSQHKIVTKLSRHLLVGYRIATIIRGSHGWQHHGSKHEEEHVSESKSVEGEQR